jgi:hypothetical protein
MLLNESVSVAGIIYCQMIGSERKYSEMEKMGKIVIMLLLRHSPGICLQGLRKTMKNLLP